MQNQAFYGNIKAPIDSCMSAILNILRPFEGKSIWGQQEGEQANDGTGNHFESSLGFLNPRHDDEFSFLIEEEDDEDNEEEEDEDESSED